jgi:hypothetical protein
MTKPSIEAALQAAVEGKTVLEISAAAGVSINTFYAMLDADNSALTAYTKARDRGYDALADSMMAIASDEQDVQRARLKCDNIKWLLARRASGKYGDKLSVDISGSVDLTAIMADSAKRLRPMRDLPAIEGESSPVIPMLSELGAPANVSVSGTDSLDDLLR